MTHHKNYGHESQDARRHDQHNDTHPIQKTPKKPVGLGKNHHKKMTEK